MLLTYCVFYDFAGEYAGYLNAFPCYISGEAFFRNLPVEPRTAAVPRPFSRRYFEVAGLVAAGFGIAIVPKIPLLDTMDVCVRPIISPEIERYIYLVLKKEKYLTPVVKDFISFITDQSEFA